VWVFGDGGSNGAIFDSNKFKMAAAAILNNFEWPLAIFPQLLTIYLYSARRAVIFAIAQLSCSIIRYHFPVPIWIRHVDLCRDLLIPEK